MTTFSTRTTTRLALTVLGLSLALPVATAHGSTAPQGACTDEDGITVVVDKTDVGGDVEIGCAEAGAPDGTSALRAAGFTDTRDAAGMICAIDALPDPCPATFEGSYWSYWSAEDGEWVAYQVGSDTSTPAPGSVEGWRYNDGMTGPGIAPAELAAVQGAEEGSEDGAEAAEQEPAADAADDQATGTDQKPASEDSPWTTLTVVGAAVLLTAAVVALLLAARARRDRG